MKNCWTKLLSAGTLKMEQKEQRLGVTKGINLLSLLLIFLNVVAALAFAPITGGVWVCRVGLGEALALSIVILLNYLDYHQLAKSFFYIVLNAGMFFFSAVLGPAGEAQLMVVFIIGVIFFAFGHPVIRVLCVLGTLTASGIVEWNFKVHFIQPILLDMGISDLMRWSAYPVIVALVAVLFCLFSWNHNRILTDQQVYSSFIQESLEQQLNNNVRKNSFIRTAYHEIRSQFKGIKMMIMVMDRMKEVKAIPEMARVLRDANAASDNVEGVMNNILEWSRYEAGVAEKVCYEPVDASVFFETLAGIARYDANEKDVKIYYDAIGDFGDYVLVDKVKITQIVTNLLSNAIKFSKPGGSIFLLLERFPHCWKIVVKDEGKGIAPDRLQKIFNPFETEVCKENVEGMGLGLTVCERLVTLLHGSIEVASQLGVGSRFTVILPVSFSYAEEYSYS